MEKLDLTGCTLSQVSVFSSSTKSESVVITISALKQGPEKVLIKLTQLAAFTVS